MTWRPLQRRHAILPAEVVRSGATDSPNEAFRSIVDSVRRIDLDRPRVLLDVWLDDWTTSETSYVDVLDQMAIRTSDDITSPTRIGATFRLRFDARCTEIDARCRIYNSVGTLIQTLSVSNGTTDFTIERDDAVIAVAQDTTYRVRVDAQMNGAGFGTLTHIRLSEYST